MTLQEDANTTSHRGDPGGGCVVGVARALIIIDLLHSWTLSGQADVQVLAGTGSRLAPPLPVSPASLDHLTAEATPLRSAEATPPPALTAGCEEPSREISE